MIQLIRGGWSLWQPDLSVSACHTAYPNDAWLCLVAPYNVQHLKNPDNMFVYFNMHDHGAMSVGGGKHSCCAVLDIGGMPEPWPPTTPGEQNYVRAYGRVTYIATVK